MERTSFLKKEFNSAIFLALITAYGYCISFCYEYGYCTHFGMPEGFIEVNLTTMFFSIVSSLAILTSIFHLLGFTLPLFKKSLIPSKLSFIPRFTLLMNAVAIVLIMILLRAYGLNYDLLKLALIIWSVLNIPFIVVWLLVKGDMNKLTENQNVQSKDPFDLTGLLIKHFGPMPLIVTIVFAVSGGVAAIAGNSAAVNQTEFWLLKQYSRNYVLIRKYSDSLFFAKVNLKTNEIDPSIALKKVGSDKFVKLEFVNIGQVTLKAASAKVEGKG